jgi:TonB family protein
MLPTIMKKFWVICAIIATVGFSRALGVPVRQQPSVGAAETAITALANNLADPLVKAKAKKVIVFSLTASNGTRHVVGKWIADKLSAAISTQNPKLIMIDRTRLPVGSQTPVKLEDEGRAFDEEIQVARSLGADVAIMGDFAAVAGRIGVSLSVVRLSELDKVHVVRTGAIPLSTEITELTPEALPGLETDSGVPRAGKSGISMPTCISCIPPRKVPGQTGTVRLELVISQEGRPLKIKVFEASSPQMGASAAQAVRIWRFKPALDLDGNPIAVATTFQVGFLQ